MNSKKSFYIIILSVFISYANHALGQGLGVLYGNAKFRTEAKDWIPVDTFQLQLFRLHGDSLVRSQEIFESKFELIGLKVGLYTIVCTSEKYGKVSQEIIIGGDRITFVDIDFTPPRKKRKKLKK